MNPAKSARLKKERLPALYCRDKKCLWRLSSGACPKHGTTQAELEQAATTLVDYLRQLRNEPRCKECGGPLVEGRVRYCLPCCNRIIEEDR